MSKDDRIKTGTRFLKRPITPAWTEIVDSIEAYIDRRLTKDELDDLSRMVRVLQSKKRKYKQDEE